MWPPRYTLNRLANNEFGEISSWLPANDQERMTEALARNAVMHACKTITDPTGCWRTDPNYLGTCKPCKNYANKLASLASHVVDLCHKMTIDLEDGVKDEITMCCLGCVQNESTQRVIRRAAHYVDIRNVIDTNRRDSEAQMLGEYLVNTCLHGNRNYLRKRNDMQVFGSEAMEENGGYQPIPQALIVQLSKVTLVFETLETQNATPSALSALDTIQQRLQEHKEGEAKNLPFHNVTITKFETSKSYTDTQIHTPEPIVVRKLEVTFEDFGPQIPGPPLIPFRKGDEDLHRISELHDGQYGLAGKIGEKSAYHTLPWNTLN